MTVQRIPFRMRNDSTQAIRVAITDRPVEIKTTSLSADVDQLPPAGTLETFLGDDDVVVFTPGGISIEKA